MLQILTLQDVTYMCMYMNGDKACFTLNLVKL